MHPYYIARTVGGLFFLIGAAIGFYNIWMTVREPGEQEAGAGMDPDEPATAPAGAVPAGAVPAGASLPAGGGPGYLGFHHTLGANLTARQPGTTLCPGTAR